MARLKRTINPIIADIIRMVRKTNRMTQKQFANRLSVSLQAVQNWEQGVNYPGLDKFIEIVELFPDGELEFTDKLFRLFGKEV